MHVLQNEMYEIVIGLILVQEKLEYLAIQIRWISNFLFSNLQNQLTMNGLEVDSIGDAGGEYLIRTLPVMLPERPRMNTAKTTTPTTISLLQHDPKKTLVYG